MSDQKILVIGSGSWGTAIANLIAKNGHDVLLSSIEPKVIKEINDFNSNSNYLPGVVISTRVVAIGDYRDVVTDCDLVFIVVPSAAIADIFSTFAKIKFQSKTKFIICSKGIEPGSLKLLTDAFEEQVKNKNYAVLSGPNFAVEVAVEAPTITNVAAHDKKLADQVIAVLNNDYFKAHYFDDPRSVEVASVIKNIIAIGCGIADGLDLGINADAAIVTKGAAEIRSLCKALKASPDINHAAGIGDIFLTCSSDKSRNHKLGRMIALGQRYEEIIKREKITCEGAVAVKLVIKLAAYLNLDLELCKAMNEVIYGKLSVGEIKSLLIKAVLS